MSGRVSSSSLATSLASCAMCLPENGFVSPSLIIESIALASPMRKPKRASLSRYGAFDIDSIPPPTPTSRSPARIAASSSPAARIPEAQTLLIVSEETSFGIPALICAWRDGIWPCPAWSTCPITTCWTCSGATSARSSAALIAVPPSSVASRLASPPPSLPIGVRAADEDHGLGHAVGLRCRWCGATVRPKRHINPSRRRVARVRAVHVQATTEAPLRTDADTIVVGVFEGEDVAHDRARRRAGSAADIRRGAAGIQAPGGHPCRGRRFILVGLGARDDFDGERARVAAARRPRGAPGSSAPRTLCWEVPHHVGDAIVAGLVEGTLLHAYRFDRYKRDGRRARRHRQRLILSAHHDVADAGPSGRDHRRRAQNRARDLGNTPANDLTPEALADYAAQTAERLGD